MRPPGCVCFGCGRGRWLRSHHTARDQRFRGYYGRGFLHLRKEFSQWGDDEQVGRLGPLREVVIASPALGRIQIELDLLRRLVVFK